jgi:hypothetical protein
VTRTFMACLHVPRGTTDSSASFIGLLRGAHPRSTWNTTWPGAGPLHLMATRREECARATCGCAFHVEHGMALVWTASVSWLRDQRDDGTRRMRVRVPRGTRHRLVRTASPHGCATSATTARAACGCAFHVEHGIASCGPLHLMAARPARRRHAPHAGVRFELEHGVASVRTSPPSWR